MRFFKQKILSLAVVAFTLLCTEYQLTWAGPQSNNGPVSRGIGGLIGAASGAVAGTVAGATAGANAAAESSGSGPSSSSTSASVSASAQDGGVASGRSSNGSGIGSSSSSSSPSSTSSVAATSGSTGSSSNGGSSSSGSASFESSSSSGSNGSGGSSGSSSAQALVTASSTPTPEGLIGKVKDMFKEGKEISKSSMKKDDERSSSGASAEGSSSSGVQISGNASLSLSGSGSSQSDSSSGSSSVSASASISGSGSSSNSGSQQQQQSSLSASSASASSSSSSSQSSAQVFASSGTSTPKLEGILEKMGDIIKRGKEAGREAARESVESSRIDDRRDEFKAEIKVDSKSEDQRDSSSSGDKSDSRGFKAEIKADGRSSDERNGFKAEAKIERRKGDSSNENNKDGPVDKISRLVNKGSETVRDSVHKIEDKAHEVGDKISRSMEEHISKPMQSTSGSGQLYSQGQLGSQTSASIQLKGSEKERHLVEVKRRQEVELSNRPQNLKEVVNDAKARGLIPRNEDRSALKGNHDDEKSMTVDMFDKAHEISKIPVETVLKPIDKMLGYEKDPLLRFYDNSHEILRKPLRKIVRPFENVLTGAFKTSEEARRDSERLLSMTSEQEQREARLKEVRARKEDRSIAGDIADKTLELATKPFEILLKPLDHALGFDKDGKRNPLLKTLGDIYSLSKKPIDAIAKPFESTLRKMANSDQIYQLSIKYNADKDDPKILTRLADGALNIADRVMTKPLEIVMKPLNHALDFDDPGKKNPIVDAAHSLKNATKVGFELFTMPIDRIIKEIAEIGDYRNDQERELDLERRHEGASRLVRALDKIHEVVQAPFEIVLRPVSRILGINKGGRKEPLLRAWDFVHQVVRTPIQVISKPVEDAILGEQARRGQNRVAIAGSGYNTDNGGGRQGGSSQGKASISGNIGGIKASASISTSSNSHVRSREFEENRTNIIVEGIKRIEKLAFKPLSVVTSPIRRLVLGEDDEKVGSRTENNNREIQAKARANGDQGDVSTQARVKTIYGEERPDKIITTLEKMNNVILKPLEMITQPISDMISLSDNNSFDGHQSRSQSQVQLQSKLQGQGQVGRKKPSSRHKLSRQAGAKSKCRAHHNQPSNNQVPAQVTVQAQSLVLAQT